MTELYFEDDDIEGIVSRIAANNFSVRYITELTELESGQKLLRLYDPTGNLIEVRTPVSYNKDKLI